ncbi:gp53-like domain-containing protein [Raoultella terrigena]|uniref:gp53-like domain-containing protein n=1 Tax=Raoultella terrigena TaxID=577 RepID=UPI0030E478A2
MANNNFKPFATGSGANVLSQVDYEALSALASGFLSGKASSAQVNKALRQGTFVSSCLAQFITNELNIDVLDDGDANGFLSNLISAMNSRSNAVLTTAFPKRTFGTNDFIRIPDVAGGLIIQFGSAIINSPTGTVTFPTPFPNAALAFIPVKNSDVAARFITFSNLTNAATNLYGWTSGTTSNLDSFNWVAIGF